MTFKYLTVFLFITSNFYHIKANYYWQEYFGDAPIDAVIAGKNIDGTNVHIGQAYVKNCGLVVVQITPGVKEVYATIGGVHKIDKYIKILCGYPDDFYWMPSNFTQLHLQINDQVAVIGGHEDAYGYMNIGKINFSGGTKVGKINSFWMGRAYFMFNNNGKEDRAESYEVLMYRNFDARMGEQ